MQKVNLMVENVMKINGMKINVECKITNKKSRMENILFGILVHALVRMINIITE